MKLLLVFLVAAVRLIVINQHLHSPRPVEFVCAIEWFVFFWLSLSYYPIMCQCLVGCAKAKAHFAFRDLFDFSHLDLSGLLESFTIRILYFQLVTLSNLE